MTWLTEHWSTWLTIFLICVTLILMSRRGKMRKVMSYEVTDDVCLLDIALAGAGLSAICFWISLVGMVIQLLN